MTDRLTASTITDAQLDALYAERDALASDLAELTVARQHGAYTFCDQLVGHVNMTAFATKISEKRAAIGQRADAVQYANEQKQRAGRAEAIRERVRVLADRWVKAGPPPLGTSVSRWWDTRLVELNTALDDPENQT
jgi:hypothetical protein